MNLLMEKNMDIVEKSSEFANPKTTYADTLVFTAYAWSKLLYMQAIGNTEVAGYCITGTTDPLLVTDFQLIKQQCSSVTFDLDENDMAEYQESILDTGLTIWQVCRILAHTHPGNCPNPSQIDEENFRKVFTRPDWAIMLIIAENGAVYCRLKINTAPGVEKLFKVEIDFNQDFPASNHSEWEAEYKSKVTEEKFSTTPVDYCLNNAFWQDTKEIEDNCYFESTGEVTYWHEEEEVWYNYDPIERKWYKENEAGGLHLEIPMPTQPWAQQVVAWADKNASESSIIMKEEEESDEITLFEHMKEMKD